MISELKEFFNKEFCYQTTICNCCKKENHIMIDGNTDFICHIICCDCMKTPTFHNISQFTSKS